jgi:hypothetical protein
MRHLPYIFDLPRLISLFAPVRALVPVQVYGRASGAMEILLERQSVLARLAVLEQQAGRGAGQIVLLRGEAGVGKTAVIQRFIAGRPFGASRGGCTAQATGISAHRFGDLTDFGHEFAGDWLTVSACTDKRVGPPPGEQVAARVSAKSLAVRVSCLQPV